MRKVSCRQVVIELAGVLLAIAVGLFFYFHLHQAFGLLLAALAMPAALLNLFLAARSQRRLTDPAARRNQLTGRILAPSPAFARPNDGMRTSRWILAGSDRAAILTVLGYAGFPVDWSEHKYSYA